MVSHPTDSILHSSWGFFPLVKLLVKKTVSDTERRIFYYQFTPFKIRGREELIYPISPWEAAPRNPGWRSCTLTRENKYLYDFSNLPPKIPTILYLDALPNFTTTLFCSASARGIISKTKQGLTIRMRSSSRFLRTVANSCRDFAMRNKRKTIKITKYI